MLLLTTIFERAHQVGDKVYCMYVDLAKAYDSVDRARLWSTLLGELGLSPDLVCSL